MDLSDRVLIQVATRHRKAGRDCAAAAERVPVVPAQRRDGGHLGVPVPLRLPRFERHRGSRRVES